MFSIQGYIENILDDPEIDSTTLQNFLKKANKNASRLGQIVKDLDAITKFESGVLHIQKNVFDIAQLVNEVIEELEIQASNKEISLFFRREVTSGGVWLRRVEQHTDTIMPHT